ncbi:hypothetical protein BDN71DRAFT_1513201 [Pleurotus eryngii]|uniref:Uncharacterized protein n=1 Tax=Pleurotus eryngii TaxID=5323 RepID=A0A9P6DA23_PLEER|nr:hypothetical protein BDN71DRAFT_1513201 [Pleurotus eryngii]
MMPRASKKSAPAKFYSAKQDIQEFLKKFQNLCVAFNVPETEYGEKLLDYCSKKVQDLIKVSLHYKNKDWVNLKVEMLQLYDADGQKTCHNLHALRKLTKKWRTKEISELADWALKPELPSTKAYPIEEVTKIVEYLLERGRFEYNYADSDSDSPHWYFHGSDSEDDTEDSEGEISLRKISQYLKKKKLTSKKKKKKSTQKKEESDSDSDSDKDDAPTKVHFKTNKIQKKTSSTFPAPTPIRDPVADKVTELIKRMGELSIQDPEYGALYYRAYKLDPCLMIINYQEDHHEFVLVVEKMVIPQETVKDFKN